jgi:integrase
MQLFDTVLDSLNSKHTKRQYQHHLKRFFNWQTSNKSDDITTEIINYLHGMKQEGLSYSYRNLALAAIKHYHEMHDILLNWRKIARFLGERKFDNDLRAYTREEIQKLLDVASVKYKAIIMLYASTGMRREALIDIKLSDMEYLHDYQIYKIKIYKKTPHEQLCLTTPECAKAINLYIENKDNAGEYFHRVAPNTLSTKLRELALDASVANQQMTGNKRGQFRDHIPCIHGLRKFCITQMAKAKVDTEIAKLLTGHSIGVRSKYLNYTDEDLLQEYLKAVNNLTINEENRLKLKVKSLEDEKDAKITALESKVSELSNAFSTFSSMVDPKQIIDGIHQGRFRCVAKTESEANDQKIVPGAVKIMLRKIDKGKEIQRNNLMFVPVSTK